MSFIIFFLKFFPVWISSNYNILVPPVTFSSWCPVAGFVMCSPIHSAYSNGCCYCNNIEYSIMLISCMKIICFAVYPYVIFFSALLDLLHIHKITHNTKFSDLFLPFCNVFLPVLWHLQSSFT